ncbi:MAG: hypothetical protein JW991_04445 [Candidatus Pacebacteria bacterium]|nr:hypothetical protein [Candidatus Paceibacterota bacterium]
MKSKKRINQETLTFAILTLITVLTWAGFDIYRSYSKGELSADVKKQLLPLNPKFESTVIQKLEQRREIPLSDISQIPQFKIEETEEIPPAEEGTGSAEEAPKETEL